MKKNKLFVLFIILFLSFWATAIFAQTAAPSDRPLEIKYPSLPQITTPPTTVGTSVAEYARYIYYFFLFVSGFFALGAMIYGGFRYITSVGRPEAMKDAKDQIIAAIFGVVILFSSWIVLNQINPRLTTFSFGSLRPIIPTLTPGVLLCKERVDITGAWEAIKSSQQLNKEFETASADKRKEIVNQLSQKAVTVNNVIASTTQSCSQTRSPGDIPDPYNDKVEWVYLIPSASGTAATSTQYGVILYENTKFGGKSLAFYSWDDPPRPFEWDGMLNGTKLSTFKPSSAMPFVLNFEPRPRPVWFVNLYELVDYNKANSQKWKNENITLPSSGHPAKSSTWSSNQKLGSLKIEGKFIVVFFKQAASSSGDNKPWEGEIDVFTESDTNLYDNIMGRWCSSDGVSGKQYWPCAPGGLVLISTE